MTYRINIPPTQHPRGPAIPRVAAIAAGDVIDLQHLADAEGEIEQLRLASRCGLHQDITLLHIEEARARHATIMSEYVANSILVANGFLPGAVPPGQATVGQLQRDLRQVVTRVYRLMVRHRRIARRQTQLQSRVARGFNNQAAAYNTSCCGPMPLRRFFKPTRRHGPGLPRAVRRLIRRQGLDAVEFGDILPMRVWPENWGAIADFTLEQIDTLSRHLDDDFGIVAGDDLERCREKLRNHIAHP